MIEPILERAPRWGAAWYELLSLKKSRMRKGLRGKVCNHVLGTARPEEQAQTRETESKKEREERQNQWRRAS